MRAGVVRRMPCVCKVLDENARTSPAPDSVSGFTSSKGLGTSSKGLVSVRSSMRTDAITSPAPDSVSGFPSSKELVTSSKLLAV
jgi:hypothetical protein